MNRYLIEELLWEQEVREFLLGYNENIDEGFLYKLMTALIDNDDEKLDKLNRDLTKAISQGNLLFSEKLKFYLNGNTVDKLKKKSVRTWSLLIYLLYLSKIKDLYPTSFSSLWAISPFADHNIENLTVFNLTSGSVRMFHDGKLDYLFARDLANERLMRDGLWSYGGYLVFLPQEFVDRIKNEA